jgi:sortase A
VGRAGRVLIALGILVLLFAAYQLWGTGIQEARSQDELSSEFEEALAGTTTLPATTTVPATTTPATGPTTIPPTTAPPTTAPLLTAPSPPLQGEPVARIEIPRIGTDKIVVQGVAVEDLRKGPGHYPATPLPGVRGNVAIAGHRTTFGAPFADVDQLQPGDEIVLTSVTGRYLYRVTGTRIVSPAETSVLADTAEPTLTLTSCHPKYSARERIIVSAAFDAGASSPLLEPAPAVVPTTAPPTTVPPTTQPGQTTTVAPTTTADDPVVTVPAGATATFEQGWVSDPNAWSHLALWGTVLSLIGIGAWLLGKRIPQWSAALLAIVPFTLALYFFFDNLNRLLPPNL